MHHRPTTHAVLAQFSCLILLSTCLMVVHLSVVAWPLREYPAGTTGTTRAAWKEWTPPPLPFFLLRQCAVSSYAGSLPLPASVQACSPTITLSDVLAHLLAIALPTLHLWLGTWALLLCGLSLAALFSCMAHPRVPTYAKVCF